VHTWSAASWKNLKASASSPFLLKWLPDNMTSQWWWWWWHTHMCSGGQWSVDREDDRSRCKHHWDDGYNNVMEAIERTVRTVPRLNCASMSPCSADDNKQLCHMISRRGHQIIVSTTTNCSLYTRVCINAQS
jgi:hypothetical protein